MILATLAGLSLSVGLVVLSQRHCSDTPELPPLALGLGVVSMISLILHLLWRASTNIYTNLASLAFDGVLLGGSVTTLVVLVPKWPPSSTLQCDLALFGVASFYSVLVTLAALISACRLVYLFFCFCWRTRGTPTQHGSAVENGTAKLLVGAHSMPQV